MCIRNSTFLVLARCCPQYRYSLAVRTLQSLGNFSEQQFRRHAYGIEDRSTARGSANISVWRAFEGGNEVQCLRPIFYFIEKPHWYAYVRVGATTHGPPKRDASSRQFYHLPS